MLKLIAQKEITKAMTGRKQKGKRKWNNRRVRCQEHEDHKEGKQAIIEKGGSNTRTPAVVGVMTMVGGSTFSRYGKAAVVDRKVVPGQ